MLGINLDLSKFEWIIKLLILVEIKFVFFFRLLLRKIVIGIFWFFYDFCNGFKILVKIYGVEESLKGSI